MSTGVVHLRDGPCADKVLDSNGSSDVTALPVPCAQLSGSSIVGVEDCLSMILYVPSTVTAGSDAPTFMW